MEFKKVKVGEVLSSTMYLTVVAVDKDSIKVKDSIGQTFTIKGPKLIEESMSSADQFSKEEKVSMTRMAEVLTQAGDTAFTVVFVKQDGTERVLVGKLVDTENLLGRSNVIDLQVKQGTNLRQVDHRTIKSLIIKGVKYTIKK